MDDDRTLRTTRFDSDRTSAAASAWEPPRRLRVPFWARNPHIQTVAGKYLRPTPDLPLVRERWDTPDGDFLLVDLHLAEDGSRRPLVVALHGLEGHSRRAYQLGLYRELALHGIDSVGVNFRGCGGAPNLTPRAYHSGETGDLALVLARLSERFPDRPLAAVGVSLGGNVLLKYLAETGDRARVDAAVAISVPYDLDAGARLLEETLMGRRYTRYFLDSLRAKVRAKRRLLEPLVDVEAALSARTIRRFDHLLTAPVHGFDSAEHYYADSSSGPRVGRIRTPTLLVHALDDPFLPAEHVPVSAAHENPHVRTVFTDRGGHVGFVEGPPWAPRFRAETLAADFLAAVLDPSLARDVEFR